MTRSYKIPRSVLVIVHTPDLQALLLERADHPGFWQSVTGSQDECETFVQSSYRELKEETGLDACQYPLLDWELEYEFEIFEQWRWRYAPGITRNTEHVFSLRVPRPLDIRLAPKEHLSYLWLPHDRAADRVFSWSNAAALRALPERAA